MAAKKRILITAGPTWVALDKVRVISNIATGETGFILADKFKKQGMDVTLLLGPGDFYGFSKGIKIIRFKYFSELEALLKKELRKNKYAAVIHTAAVADYKPDKIIKAKVSSRLNSWKINLLPTKKLINNLKNCGTGLLAVGFKFQPSAGKFKLIKEAKALLKQAALDLVVSNSNTGKNYCAYILNAVNHCGPFSTKEKMASILVKLVRNKLK